MEITAKLIHIRYQKPPNPWGVFIFQSGKRGFAATGNLPSPELGQEYTISGEWELTQYGKQLKAASFVLKPPTTIRGITAILCSRDVPGIGPATANAIVDRFGLKTLDLLRSDNYLDVTEVPGVGKALAERLHASLQKPSDKNDLRMLLGDSVTDAFLGRLNAEFKNPIEVIRQNPYILIEKMQGVGFIKADGIAKAIGVAEDSPQRICAAIYHFLSKAESEGHCYAYASNLEENLQDLIPSVDVKKIAAAIKLMATDTSFKKMALHVDTDGAVYLKSLYEAETKCASIIQGFLRMPADTAYTASMLKTAADEIEKEFGYRPEESQMKAVEMALNNRFSTITGGPGTGKTTTIRTIVKAINLYEPDKKIAFLAPTGRAAVRMHEVTGKKASTIHQRVYSYTPWKATDDDNDTFSGKAGVMEEDVVIIDEASMIDIRLAYALLSHLRRDASVIFIGDVDQLPPVGPGTFFRDLIGSYRVPTARLKLSFRNSGYIAANAERINFGSSVLSFTQDETFQVIPCKKSNGPEKAIQSYLDLVQEYGIRDVVLLAPTVTRGSGSVSVLNQEIQQHLNPANGEREIKGKIYTFRVHDRVLLQYNDWKKQIANGDTGTIVNISSSDVIVRFDSGNEEAFSHTEFTNKFALAYACTVHKSQGQEYKGVVFLFTSEHSFMGERNIVYTAVTRAREKLRLVCDARALNRAIGCVKPILRNSKLKERINAM